MLRKKKSHFLLYIEDKILISLVKKCVKITKLRIFKAFSLYWGQLKSERLTQISQN